MELNRYFLKKKNTIKIEIIIRISMIITIINYDYMWVCGSRVCGWVVYVWVGCVCVGGLCVGGQSEGYTYIYDNFNFNNIDNYNYDLI